MAKEGEIELLYVVRNAKSCWIEMLPLMKIVEDINVLNAGIVTNKFKEASKMNIFPENQITLRVTFVPKVRKEVK